MGASSGYTEERWLVSLQTSDFLGEFPAPSIFDAMQGIASHDTFVKVWPGMNNEWGYFLPNASTESAHIAKPQGAFQA